MSRRRGGCGSFILGFLVGFLSLILLVVGGGVLAYYKLNIKTVESWIKTEVPIGNDEFKELPLKDLINLVGQVVGNSGDITIGTLESSYGITLPDEIGGMNITRVKEVIRDCKMTDFPAMLNAVTSTLNLEEIMEMMGTTELPTTIAALKHYTVDDLLGQNGGKGLEGILSEVPIGTLLNVTDEANTEKIIWMLKDYTLLGETTGVQNMAEDLSLRDLSAMGIEFENDMLKSIASQQETDNGGNPLFVGEDKKKPIVFADGDFYAVSDTSAPVDLSVYAVLPKVSEGKLQTNAAGNLLFTDAAGGETLTYDAIADKFLKEDSAAYEFSGEALRPKLWPVAKLGSSIDSLTLGELLGDQLPDAFQSLADIKMNELNTIGVDKIYLSDIVPSGTAETDLLWKLGHAIPGSKEIDEDNDPTTPAQAAQTYRLGETDLFKVGDVYYSFDGSAYAPFEVADESALEIVSYTVADIQKAVNELTLSDVVSPLPSALESFADVKIGEMADELTMDNIYLEDVIDTTETSGVLYELRSLPGKLAIDHDNNEGTPAEVATLWRRTVEGVADKSTTYYLVGSVYYVRQNGKYLPAQTESDWTYETLSYPVSEIQSAVDEMTLEAVVGAEGVKDGILAAFAKVKIGEISEKLKPENIYLKDVAGEDAKGVLGKLANLQGKKYIDWDNDPETPNEEATLWRISRAGEEDKTTVYYKVGETHYTYDGTKYTPYTLQAGESFVVLSYSVADIQDAVDGLTLSDVLGEEPTGVLAAFAEVKIGEIGDKLTADNIFLEDIAGENATGILGKLASQHGQVEISQSASEGVPEVNGTASLYRRKKADGTVDKTTAYYVIGQKVYILQKGVYTVYAETFDESEYVTLSYPVSKVNDAMNLLTLSDVLDGNVPDILRGFANTHIGDLSTELTLDKFKLKDLASGAAEGDILHKLANVLKQTEITVEGKTYSADTYHRSASDLTEIYFANGKYYVYSADTSSYTEESLSQEQIAALVPVQSDYSVADINTAVNALTIEDFFGAQDSGALSLIGGDTKLKDVPQAVSDAITDTKLFELQKAGLLGSITYEQLESKKLPVYNESGVPTMVSVGAFNIVDIIEYVINLGA